MKERRPDPMENRNSRRPPTFNTSDVREKETSILSKTRSFGFPSHKVVDLNPDTHTFLYKKKQKKQASVEHDSNQNYNGSQQWTVFLFCESRGPSPELAAKCHGNTVRPTHKTTTTTAFYLSELSAKSKCLIGVLAAKANMDHRGGWLSTARKGASRSITPGDRHLLPFLSCLYLFLEALLPWAL